MKKVGLGLVSVIGAFLIVRAIAESFLIEVFDPATYNGDWGGQGTTTVALEGLRELAHGVGE